MRVKGAGCGDRRQVTQTSPKNGEKLKGTVDLPAAYMRAIMEHMNISGHDTLAFLPRLAGESLVDALPLSPARACSICVPKYPKQVPFVFRWCPQNIPRITPAQLRNGTEWNKTEHIFPKPAWKSPFCTGWSGPTASIRDGEQGHNQSVLAAFGRFWPPALFPHPLLSHRTTAFDRLGRTRRRCPCRDLRQGLS